MDVFETMQADGTLIRIGQCLDSPAKTSSSTANQSAFFNSPVSNGSSSTPLKKKPSAISANAKKMFDEVRLCMFWFASG